MTYYFAFSKKAENQGNKCKGHIIDTGNAICNPYMDINDKLIMEDMLSMDLCKSCKKIAEKRNINLTYHHAVVSIKEE